MRMHQSQYGHGLGADPGFIGPLPDPNVNYSQLQGGSSNPNPFAGNATGLPPDYAMDSEGVPIYIGPPAVENPVMGGGAPPKPATTANNTVLYVALGVVGLVLMASMGKH